jgi:hypothetical protein
MAKRKKEEKQKKAKKKRKKAPWPLAAAKRCETPPSLSLSAADPYHQQDQQGKAAGARRRGTRPLE